MPNKRTVKIRAANDFFVMQRLPSDLIKRLGETELKVLIYGASGWDCEPSVIAEELSVSVDDAAKALAALEKLGLIDVGEERAKKAPSARAQYDSEEIADAIDGEADFKDAVDFAADKLEKQLNRNDLNTLYTMYDYYGMPADFICGVLEYCVSINRRSLSYIFNTAIGIQSEGVESYTDLEEYLKHRRTADNKSARFRSLCGWGERELSAKERNYTNRWFGELRLGFEIVKYAYDITVDNTGKVSLPYMSKIIEKWHKAGIRTVEEAKKQEGEKPKKQQRGGADAEVEKLLAAAAEKGYLKKEG